MAKLVLKINYDRAYPSRFQHDYYILEELRKQFQRMIKDHFTGRPDAILLDYGCGSMPYRKFFEPHVEQYVGIDLPTAHERFKTEANFYIDEEGRVPDIPDNHADFLFSSMVLEHVYEPAIYLDECYRMLKPGGIALVSTLGNWIYHATPDDYWRWMAPGLRRELETAGFEVLELDGIMGMLSISAQFLQDGLRDKLPKFLRPYFIFVLQGLVQLADMPYGPYSNNRDAAAYTFVVRKPLTEETTETSPTTEEEDES